MKLLKITLNTAGISTVRIWEEKDTCMVFTGQTMRVCTLEQLRDHMLGAYYIKPSYSEEVLPIAVEA